MTTFFLKKPQKLIGAISALLTVVFVGIVVGPVFLSAQNPVTPLVDEESELYKIYDEEAALYDPDTYTATQKNPTPSEAQKGAAKSAADAAQDDLSKKFTCLSFGGININACLASLMDKVMWLSARTLWISGVLLNITLSTTLNFNDLLTSLPIVDIGWKVLRDLANIVFIFIALWAGISITLGIGDDGKKAWGLLAEMVLVALFINFSLFITKAVVDVSNVASLHFYSLIVEPGHEKDYDKGLSEAFLYGLNLSTLYDSKKLGAGGNIGADQNLIAGAIQGSGKGLSFTNIILIGFFGSLFIIVAAWVFFAAAIMFIFRAVTLMMLMMLSPLAFVGFILPGASGMAHAWWSKLWSQAFFAPLYLALAYVVVRTINADGFREGLGGNSSFAAALTGTGSPTVAVIFNFILLIGLMVGCLVVAQSLGAKGSEMAMAGWEKIKGAAVGGVVGVSGAAARGLIKAPSAGIQSFGNVGKLAQRMGTLGFMKDTKLGKKMNDFGTRFQSKEGIGANIRKVTDKAQYLDPRYLEERAGKSWLGNTMVGKAVRSVTTGAIANVKIGNQSLEEAYEEAEHSDSVRRDISHGSEAQRAGAELHTIQEVGEEHQEALHHAQGAEAAKKKELDDAEMNLQRVMADPSATPSQKTAAQAKVTALKGEIATATGVVTAAKKVLDDWKAQTENEQKKLRAKISSELANMSTEGFLNLPKHYFKMNSIMDIEVLGAEKFGALMNSEHFSTEEKEEFTEARTERIEHEGERMTEKNKWRLQEMRRWEQSQSEWEKAQAPIAANYATHTQNVENDISGYEATIASEKDLMEHAERSGNKAQALVHKGNMDTATTALKARSADLAAIPALQMDEEKRAGLRNASGEKILAGKVLGARPKQAGWESPGIRKALRNIKNPQELLHYYRYKRGLFNLEPFVQTVGQGMWNRVRESETVDSGTKENIRVTKRQYLQEASDYSFGGDATLWKEWEKKSPVLAQKVRDELNKYILAYGEEAFKREYWTPDASGESKLGKLFKDAGFAGEASVSYNERELRHKTGQDLMEENILNLADDEAAMLPGTLRNLHWVKSVLSRGLFSAFKNKDLDEKIPDMQNLITSVGNMFKGENKERKGNIDFLVWLVNERGGKEFISDEQMGLSGENKQLWEAIKALAKQRDDFRGSTFKSKNEALRWLKENGYAPSGKPLRSPWRTAGINARGEDTMSNSVFYAGI